MRTSAARRSGIPDPPGLGMRTLISVLLAVVLTGLVQDGALPALAQNQGPSAATAGEGLAEWTFVEDLRFPVIDPSETAFPDVRDVVVGPDGRLFLGLYHLRSIRAFDPNGRFLGAFGSPGSQPGQMAGIRHLGRLGDTIVAIDFRRAVFFGPDGTARGDLWATRSLSDAVPRFERLLPGGQALFRLQADSVESGNASDEASSGPSDDLLLFGPRDGTEFDTVAKIPEAIRPDEFRIERGGRTMGWTSPYTFEPLHDVARNGLVTALVDRPQPDPSAAEGASWGLLVIGNSSGDTLVDRRYPYTPEPVDADLVLSALSEGFASAFGVPTTEIEPEARRNVVLPAAAPPLTEVHAADNGQIWIRLWHTPGAASTWMVLDPTGEPVARTTLPAEGEILRIDDGVVYATVRSGETLEFVRYRIERERD